MKPLRSLIIALLSTWVLGCDSGEEQKATSKVETAVAPLTVPRGLLVARGLGRIAGLSQTNSIEALRCNYKRGFRWFEVDLAVTADGELMCFRRGNEKRAGLPDQISSLTAKDAEAVSYAGRFPILRVSALLNETDKLGDVVLVADTGRLSKATEQALSRTLGYGPRHPTRIVLQAYTIHDLPRTAALAKEVGAGLLLNVNTIDANDEKIAAAAQKHPLLGVVANRERFTPWLAARLHEARVPILVNTVNDHEEIVSLASVGADGFYTDTYVPFGALAADPTAALECGETKPSTEQLEPWLRRDLQRASDYELRPCAKRKGSHVELANCDDRAAIYSTALAARAKDVLQLEIEAEAGPAGATVWTELVHDYKKGRRPLRPREAIKLKPNERRAMKVEIPITDESPGVEARLGLGSKKDTLIVHRLALFNGSLAGSELGRGGASERGAPERRYEGDAGD